MRTEARAFLASLLLHVFFVGGALGLVSLVPSQPTLLQVDFSVAPGPPGTGAGGQKGALSGSVPGPANADSVMTEHGEREETQAARAVAAPAADSLPPPQAMHKTRPPRLRRKRARSRPARPAAAVTQAKTAAPADAPSGGASAGAVLTSNTASLRQPPKPLPRPLSDTERGAKGQTFLPLPSQGRGPRGLGFNASGVGGSTAGAGTGGGDTLQARYLREEFAYIRELIGRRLRYPPIALHSGWSGRVVVSFIVQESGEVRDLRVEQSSGIGLLDRDAAETIRRAAPFPKPPVSARLVIPVDYILE